MENKIETLLTEDGAYETTLTEKYKNRKAYEPVNFKHIGSKIPGTVRKIFVEEGQKVEKGEVLLELEYMKMINNVAAAECGEVKRIFVKENEKISADTVIMDFV